MGFNLVHLVCTTTLASLLFAAFIFVPNAAAAHEVMMFTAHSVDHYTRFDEHHVQTNWLAKPSAFWSSISSS